MTKRMLMLSVAGAALLSGSAFAQTTTPPLDDITTKVTSAVSTATACANSTPCDVTIDTGGSVTIEAASPAVTVNSNNSLTIEGTISNTKTTGAVGVQIDTGFTNTTMSTTTQGSGIEDLGTIDLSGSGTGKTAIELIATTPTTANPTPSQTYTGNITSIGATTTVAGDGGTGLLIGTGTTLVGNIDLGDTMTLTPTTTTETDNVGINAIRIDGTVQGNVTLDGATITAQGNGAQGFLLDGSITGTLINTGSVQTVGITSTQNPQTGQITGPSNSGDPEGGSAMLIGGSVGGGFLNSGKVNTSDTTNVTATIETEGNSPALRIDPSLQDNEFSPNPVSAITLGVYADTTDPGFSFYNRGTIESGAIDPNLGTTGMLITGAQGFTTTLKGLGLFNSGTIGVFGQTDTKTSSPIGVVALSIQNFTNIGDPTATAGLCGTYTMTAGLCNSNENGGGIISATVQGVQGSTAIAIEIGSPGSTTEQLPTLVNLGTIQASSTTSEPSTITSIAAYGIIDYSGTLSNIANYGTIAAQATTLTDNAQTQVALNLLANTTGITLFNQGTIKGDVLLGLGNDFVHVVGTSPQSPASLSGNIYFNESGATGGDALFVDSFGIVSGSITEGSGSILNVHVAEHGTLGVENTTQSLTANDFIVDDNAAALNLAVSSQLVNVADQNVPVVQASDKISIGDNVPFSVSYSSYIPSAGNFILLQAPIGNLDISSSELNLINTDVGGTIPFLFTSQSGLCGYNLNVSGLPACTTGTAPEFSQLVLQLVPKTSQQLGLEGYAAQMFPYANAALATDATLGAGLVNSVTSNAVAESNYSAFAPDASGGTRAVAVALTDQATGPVASRQRALRMYGTQPGDNTLWGQEFTQFLNDKGNNNLPGYQNRGFGFAVGGDVGDPSGGKRRQPPFRPRGCQPPVDRAVTLATVPPAGKPWPPPPSPW